MSTELRDRLQRKQRNDALARLRLASPEAAEAINRILAERAEQFRKWGEQNHDMMTWLAILHEETGELAEACLHQKFGGPEAQHIFKEAVQTAAVACQIVEYLIRQLDGSHG